jgi:hypothetical protein
MDVALLKSIANLHIFFVLYNSLDEKVKTNPLFFVVEVISVTIFQYLCGVPFRLSRVDFEYNNPDF